MHTGLAYVASVLTAWAVVLLLLNSLQEDIAALQQTQACYDLHDYAGQMEHAFNHIKASMTAEGAAGALSQEHFMRGAQVGVERVLLVFTCVCTCSSAGNTTFR
jgi:hypothetical protein